MNRLFGFAALVCLLVGLSACGARPPVPNTPANPNAQLDALAAEAVDSGAIKPLAADYR